MFKVHTVTQGCILFLRGTVLTLDVQRASVYKTPEEAQTAIETARKYYPSYVLRGASVIKIGEARHEADLSPHNSP